MLIRAKLTKVSATVTRDGSKTTIGVEMYDGVPGDWLMEHLGDELMIELAPAPPSRTPLEEAIEVAEARR